MIILRMIQGLLLVLGIVIVVMFLKDYRKNKETDVTPGKQFVNYVIGFVLQFLDALGIGSFAPTMAAFKLTKNVPDRLIPGTLNIGASVPVIVAALLFITVIEIDTTTLVLMTIAGVIGAIAGVYCVRILPENGIRATMALGLLIAGVLMLCSKFGWIPAGGTAIGLTGVKLVIGLAFNFILGLLLPMGIGNYAPCMVLVYMLGMSPAVAFPLMMSSAAFGLSASTVRFIKEGTYQRKAAWGIIAAGSVGVVIAVKIVKSLPLNMLQWLVIIVVLYTSITLFRQAVSRRAVRVNEKEA